MLFGIELLGTSDADMMILETAHRDLAKTIERLAIVNDGVMIPLGWSSVNRITQNKKATSLSWEHSLILIRLPTNMIFPNQIGSYINIKNGDINQVVQATPCETVV